MSSSSPSSLYSDLPPPPTYDESLNESLVELHRLELELRERDSKEARFNVVLVAMVAFVVFVAWLRVASDSCHASCTGRHFPT